MPQLLGVREGQGDTVAGSEGEGEFRLQGAFDVQVEFGLGQRHKGSIRYSGVELPGKGPSYDPPPRTPPAAGAGFGAAGGAGRHQG